jgi:excinuclease UvrABC ATPase subunit
VKADGFLDLSKSLAEGAVQVPVFAAWENNLYAKCGLFDVKKKLAKFTKAEMELLLHGTDRKYKTMHNGQTFNASYEGIIAKFTKAYITRDLKLRPERTQKLVEPYLTMGPCTQCHGARLNQAALASKIGGKNIADCAAMEIGDLLPWVRKLEGKIEQAIANTLVERLQAVVEIGLGYLSLERPTDTLSGGESQRVKMVKHLGSSLVDVLYIFDEPSVGLHPRDVHRLGELLRALRDKGNTILVVEHDPDVIEIADHIVDVGPHAGARGGQIVFEGTFAELKTAGTLTATHLFRASKIKDAPRKPKGKLSIKGANANNLQNVSVDVPTGVLTVVTGVAGSGKSSLIHACFVPAHPDAIVIDQAAIGASSRSTPATYTGVMDDLRKELADANDVDAGLFSFNSKGACEACNGLGVIYTDLAFLDGVKTSCETCHGRRFKDEVLAYTLGGKHVGDLLAMTVAEALQLFETGPGAKAKKPAPILRKLRAMRDVGIGYLTLGQPLNTLSGGECQRIKLASELHKTGSIYVLDEPTTGLHLSDITHLLAIVDRLVDAGNTVVIIEHHLDVVRHADWIIDLGPEGGSKGGKVVFEGTPAQLANHKTSITAKYVRGDRARRATEAAP